MKTIVRNFLSVLRRYRLATVLNVLGLSVAFAAFMVIMMQVDYDRNFDRCHPEADHIYRLEIKVGDMEWSFRFASPGLQEAFCTSSPHVVAEALIEPYVEKQVFSPKETKGESYSEFFTPVTPGFTDVFTFEMLEGTEKALENTEKALIPQSLARKLFGNEPATGRLLTMKKDSMTYTVGGVYRDFPRNSSLANCIYTRLADTNIEGKLLAGYFRTDGQIGADELIEMVRKNFDPALSFGKGMTWDEIQLRLRPLPGVHYAVVAFDSGPKTSRQTVLILIVVAFMIVAIAGINFTNFSAALAPKRIRSINTQKILGGETRIIRAALMAEAVAICLVSFLCSLMMISLMQDTFLTQLVEADLSLTAWPGLLGMTAGLAVLVGLVAGAYPSYYMTSFPPTLTLKGNFGLSPKGKKLRNALMGIQFVASFTLIIGGAFMYLQNRYMLHAPLGYDKEALIVSDLTDRAKDYREALTAQLKTFPGVTCVTYASAILSSRDNYSSWGMDYHDRPIRFQVLSVDPSFLDVMRIRVSEGRSFREEDGNTAQGVYIFNEEARDEYGLVLNDRLTGGEIVGFVSDVKVASFRTAVTPMAFFVPGTEFGSFMVPNHVYVRMQDGSDLRAARAHVRKTLDTFDEGYPFDVRFFDEILNRTYEKEQQFGTLITLFSLVAVLIAIVGVFGLVVFDSEYRRKEIGIRKVFGATTSEILVTFNKAYVRILCICFVLSAPVAWYAVSRWLENFAYKTPMYGWVYAVAFVAVFVLTVATVTFQNWRAANMNPVESIKAN